MKKTLRNILYMLLAVLLVGGYLLYDKVFKNNLFQEQYTLYIPTGADFDKVKATLENDKVLNNAGSFELLAHLTGYTAKVHPGKYVLKQPMNNMDLIWLLQSGRQTPVKLVLNKFRLKADLCGFISHNLEIDSAGLFTMLDNAAVTDSLGLKPVSSLALFIPNTYEFYWNTPADKFLDRIGKEYRKFWTDERLQAAKAKHLSPEDAMILASIIEEETNNKAERPKIAGVYLNRLNDHMKLQADPTLKFAAKDFALKRITGIISIESPYNTYLNTGLPPGPICTPSINAIDAVLHAEKHNYLYFCAEYGTGKHLFAETYKQHLINARAYHKELDDNGVF